MPVNALQNLVTANPYASLPFYNNLIKVPPKPTVIG
jgi:hypothetical protein